MIVLYLCARPIKSGNKRGQTPGLAHQRRRWCVCVGGGGVVLTQLQFQCCFGFGRAARADGSRLAQRAHRRDRQRGGREGGDGGCLAGGWVF